MRCTKCESENFILETTIALTEKYKIYKNGRTSDHPIEANIAGEDMADNDNIVRCMNCKTGFVLPQKSRMDLINKVDFSKIDLKNEGIEVEF